MAAWGVACILREPQFVVEKFVNHHLGLGAHEIFLFFDDPGDPSLDWARTRVRAYSVDEVFAQFGRPVPDTHEVKQSGCYRFALRETACEWLAILDADEFLFKGPDMGGWLDSVPAGFNQVRVRPREAIFSSLADARVPFNTRSFRIPSNLKTAGDRKFFRRGVAGHMVGKFFVRKSPDVLSISLHAARERDPDARMMLQTEILLAHFDAISYDLWVEKFGRRATGKVNMQHMGDKRLVQLQAFSEAVASGREEKVEQLFCELYVRDDRQQERMNREGTLFRADPF